MSKSVSKTSPAGPEEARTWFVEHYSACADLDTRLIPDLHTGGKVEILFLNPMADKDNKYTVLMKPYVKTGQKLI